MRGDARSLFDRIAVVDWSARSSPATGTDSIWVAVMEGERCTVENLRTRRDAVAAMAALVDRDGRTLIGVDFSLGYPAGTAEAFGLTGVAWSATWALLAAMIRDDDRNANNRFDVASELNARLPGGPGPFWGCPPTGKSSSLTPTKPPTDSQWPPAWRHVERVLRDDRHRPFSAWQLLGAGSVGGQSLVGIAALERLRWNLGDALAVWPFTTGLKVPTGDERIVLAEVWPSFWPVEIPPGMVKDAAQVESTARLLSTLDIDGRLADLFTPIVDRQHRDDVVTEEGWVLGVAGVSSERAS